MIIFLEDLKFNIIHRTNKKIKRISLALENKTEIIVKTPLGIKSHQLREIVLHHQTWILNSIKKVPAKNQFDFVCGGKLPFIGVQYPIELIIDEKMKNPKFVLKDETFYIYYNEEKCEYDDFVDGLKKFYQRMAIKTIDPLFDKWCHETKMYPENISYRRAKRRWGSCSHINNISINYMLLQFPIEAVEYVVLHELCHIQEKNHSKRFWNLVSLYMPDYKSQEKVLKSKLF
ncbi:MAG: M48 family metallopeptidase [Arcobacteraceae bacterium]|nr:M48 family metallopeptidase [Arcobacteraceae bacterium]